MVESIPPDYDRSVIRTKYLVGLHVSVLPLRNDPRLFVPLPGDEADPQFKLGEVGITPSDRR